MQHRSKKTLNEQKVAEAKAKATAKAKAKAAKAKAETEAKAEAKAKAAKAKAKAPKAKASKAKAKAAKAKAKKKTIPKIKKIFPPKNTPPFRIATRILQTASANFIWDSREQCLHDKTAISLQLLRSQSQCLVSGRILNCCWVCLKIAGKSAKTI